MSRYIYLLGVLLAMALNLISCSDNDDIKPVLTVTPTTLNFGSDATSQKITINAEFVKWEAKSSSDWISWALSTESDSEVIISVVANKLNEARKGTVTFSGNGVSDVVVEITQEAYKPEPTLTTDKQQLEFAFDGSKQLLTVDAQNVEWVATSSTDWLKFEVNSQNPSELWVILSKNESNTKREGILTLSGNGVSDVVVNVVQQRDFVNSPIIWDRNSLYFAKLLGKVSFVDFTDFYGRNVNFDTLGFVKDFIIKMQDNQGNEYEFTVKYEYSGDRRITKIYTQGITVDFIYGEHANYVEVAKDVFSSIGLSQVYLFLPDYLKGIKRIVATHPEATVAFDFNFSGNQLSVLADNQLWRKIEYKDGFPLRKQYSEAGQKKGEDGQIKKYTNYIIQEFSFDSTNGKLSKIVTDEEYKFDDTATPNEVHTFTYTYLADKYNNIQTEGENVRYTYDSYGDWDKITAQTPDFENIDSYQYTRDDIGNWTRRIDRAVFRGEEWTYDDKRVVKYYK